MSRRLLITKFFWLTTAIILTVSQPIFAASFVYQAGSTDVTIDLTQPNEIISIKALSGAYEFTLTNGSWLGTFTGATVTGATLTFQKSAFPSGTTIIRVNGMAYPGNQVQFLNSGTNTYDSYLAVNLLNKPGAVTFDGETRFSGTSRLSINTYKNIVLNPGSYISTESGLIYFKAGKDERDTANYSGIEVNGGTFHLQGWGSSVLLEGYAGTGTGVIGDMHGIHFRNGGKITGGSTSQLTLKGFGTSILHPSSRSYGVFIEGNSADSTGMMVERTTFRIEGTGLSNAGDASGIVISQNAVIQNKQVDNDYTLLGVGGNSSGLSHGVVIQGTVTQTPRLRTTGGGQFKILGTGNGTSLNVASYGVLIGSLTDDQSSAFLHSDSSGIYIDALSGTGSGNTVPFNSINRVGLAIGGRNVLLRFSGNGSSLLYGTSQSSAFRSTGNLIQHAQLISSEVASFEVVGRGSYTAAGKELNGIWLTGATQLLSMGQGSIVLNGYGGGRDSSTQCNGVLIDALPGVSQSVDTVKLAALTTGRLITNGYGSDSIVNGDENNGILIRANQPYLLQSQAGPVFYSGYAYSGGSGIGVSIAKAVIKLRSNEQLTISGWGGGYYSNNTVNCHGIELSDSTLIENNQGDIVLDGNAGGGNMLNNASALYNIGVIIASGCKLNIHDYGSIRIIGKGGNTGENGYGIGQHGISLYDCELKTHDGAINLFGTAGGNQGTANHATGILVGFNTHLICTGSGNMFLSGNAGKGGGVQNTGVLIDGDGAISGMITNNGSINVEATGPESSTAIQGVSFWMQGEARILTDSGSVTVSTIGGTSLLDTTGYGIFLEGPEGLIQSHFGSIYLGAIGAPNSIAFLHNGGKIQVDSGAGNIAIFTDHYKISDNDTTAYISNAANDSIYLAPINQVSSMIIGTNDADRADTLMRISTRELSRFKTGKLILGGFSENIYLVDTLQFSGSLGFETGTDYGLVPSAPGYDIKTQGDTVFCPTYGQLKLKINGTQVDSLTNGYQRLKVQGIVNLNGAQLALDVQQISDTVAYELVSADSLIGPFANFPDSTLITFQGKDFRIRYTPTQVLLAPDRVVPSVTMAFVSGHDSVCAGTPVVVRANAVNGGNAPLFQWHLNGQLQSSNADTLAFNPSQGDSLWVKLTSNAPGASPSTVTSTDTILFQVNPLLAPAVALQASSDTACLGTAVTFTANPTHGGNNPVYTFYVNGNSVQSSTSNQYTISALAHQDTVMVMMQANNRCQSASTVSSSNQVMSILAPVTPSVTLTSSADTICAGSTVTFTALALNSGNAPVFSFSMNGNTVQAGSNNTFTSNSITATDTVQIVVTANGSCQTSATAISNQKVLVVNPTITPSINISASSDTLCAGTAVIISAFPIQAGSGSSINFLLNGVSVQSGSSTAFNTNVLAHQDSIQAVLTTNHTCQTSPTVASNTLYFVVNPATSIVFPAINDLFNSSDTIVLSPTPAGGTLSGPGVFGLSFRPWTVDTGLTTLTYTFTNAQGCTSSLSRSFRVLPDAIVWDGTQWKYGTPGPAQGTRDLMVIAGNSPVIPNGSACKNLVLRGGSLTHSLNNLLIINNNLNLRGGTMTGGGALNFSHSAAQITSQSNTTEFRADIEIPSGANLQNINAFRLAPGSNVMAGSGTPNGGGTTSGSWTLVQRGSTQLNAWNAFSSPVVNGTGRMIQGLQHFSFDVPSQAWQVWDSNLVMTNGRGYIARAATNGWFRGTLNNGAIAYNVTKNASGSSWNLIGNPYPSQLSWSDFLTANLNINGTAYFMKSNVNVNNVVNDYTAINGLMIGAEIPVHQGFFVEANATGAINFTNAMRRAGRTSFYTRANQTVDLIWLKAFQQSDSAQASTTVVGFKADATTGFDRMYDGRLLKGDGSLFVYSLLNQEPMAIQGLPTLTAPVIVPLGVDANAAGTVVFRLDSTNMDPSVRILLEDLQTSTTHNLRQSAYQTQVAAGQNQSGRFRLLVNPFATTTPTIVNNQPIKLYAFNQTLVIDELQGRRVKEVRLTDLSGRVIENWQQPQGETRIELPTTAANGVYLLTVITTDGTVQTDRVLVRY